MSILTILLFIVYTWGLGFSATYFFKNSDNFLERNLMRMGVGLGVFPVLSVFLNLLRIPLDWRIFLAISLLLPLFFILKDIKTQTLKLPHLRLTKQNLAIVFVLLLFFATLFMYTKGAFNYPYLEDDDPWNHALSVKFVSLEKTAFSPPSEKKLFGYMDPYPPGYGILLGVLHQTSKSLSWTLKFFNALIISLGIIFFYFFAKEFIGDVNKALFSTFILVMIPCYLSHFIWAHSLIVTLFFPAFYCLERIKKDKRWMYASSLVIASILVTQPSQNLKFAIMFLIYWIIKAIIQKRFLLHILLSGILGVAFSMFWWGPMFFKYGGLGGVLGGLGFAADGFAAGKAVELGIIGALGTGTRLYTFRDFFIAKSQNLINNPIGVGIIISLLMFISLIFLGIKYKSLFSKDNSWKLISLGWLIFTFLGIHGGTRLPIALYSFRFWMLFAIPVSLLSSIGLWILIGFFQKYKVIKVAIISLVLIGIIFTSGQQKYAVNTAIWGPGAGWGSMDELQGYLWLNNFPPDTKIYPLSLDSNAAAHITGFDHYTCAWCKDEIEFGAKDENMTSEEMHSWLRNKEYEYVILDYNYMRKYGANKTNDKITEFRESGVFQPVHQTQGMIIMRLV